METLITALEWLVKTSLPPASILALLGYIFREKWKQVLTKSLAADLEQLKHQLALEQASHAASLTPQLELIKHDFQQKLEAYKVSLIAQAEEVKNRSDVKKRIAVRYVEIKFERLVSLERELSRAGALIMSRICYPEAIRRLEQITEATEVIGDLQEAAAEADMFLEIGDGLKLATAIRELTVQLNYIGPGKQVIAMDSDQWCKCTASRVAVEKLIREKIHKLAEI